MMADTNKYEIGDIVEVFDPNSTIFNGVQGVITDRKYRYDKHSHKWEWSYNANGWENIYVSEALLIPAAGDDAEWPSVDETSK